MRKDSPIIQEWVQDVSLSSKIRPTNVAFGHALSTSPHYARLPRLNGIELAVKDIHRVVRCRSSDGEWAAYDMPVHCVDDSCLSWAAAVVVDAMNSPCIGKPGSPIVSNSSLEKIGI